MFWLNEFNFIFKFFRNSHFLTGLNSGLLEILVFRVFPGLFFEISLILSRRIIAKSREQLASLNSLLKSKTSLEFNSFSRFSRKKKFWRKVFQQSWKLKLAIHFNMYENSEGTTLIFSCIQVVFLFKFYIFLENINCSVIIKTCLLSSYLFRHQ